ncbi:MAG: serine/threonine protein kinase [Acidobacteriota bacterium]|nr:serine/threonine protein kinase [Acidobacteriota bacterium]
MKTCPNCGAEYPDTTTLCPSDGVALEQTGDSLLGQVLAGKYRIDERLNEGGMGAVYRGTHVLMDKTVAVKVLRPALAADEKLVARFSREARAASRISHPHALSVTDFGESEDGVVFLVMEYLDGKTLKEIIREEGPLPLPRVVEILRQVGGALNAAHGQGVVHRDLKSENIMLLNSAGPDYAKVLDFGIAKIQEPTGAYNPGLTAPDLVIGTPQYMSPEQCSQASEIDARSDLYSLGVIIYEMLVGHVPFTGPSPTAIMMKHLQDEAPSILQERADLPSGVGRVVQRAMAKRPDDRYQHVGDLVEDLTMASGVEGAAVPPVPTSSAGHGGVDPAHSTGERATEPDEETMVRPRVENRPVPSVAPPASEIHAASPASNLNLWKVLISSLAGLLLVFAVVYAFTKNSEPVNNNQPLPGLVADPNSQAVEPSPPATGKTEADIPLAGTPANQVTNANENANANADPDPDANAEATPSPTVTVNSNANSNIAAENSNQNTNKLPPANVPLPSPSNRVNTNEQPPPPPPGAKPTPQPSAKPPDVSDPPS